MLKNTEKKNCDVGIPLRHAMLISGILRSVSCTYEKLVVFTCNVIMSLIKYIIFNTMSCKNILFEVTFDYLVLQYYLYFYRVSSGQKVKTCLGFFWWSSRRRSCGIVLSNCFNVYKVQLKTALFLIIFVKILYFKLQKKKFVIILGQLIIWHWDIITISSLLFFFFLKTEQGSND